MTAAVIPSTRHISAGVSPEPGAAARRPAWWGADNYLNDVAAALLERPELLAEHHVSADAVVKVAERMASFADHRTGRDCRPTNVRLVELCQCSLSTVQRARRVLKALGLVVELIRGRSLMSRSERLEAWRRGSSHRKIAATFALCSRRRRAPKVSLPKVREASNYGCAPVDSVERDTPPGAAVVRGFSHLRNTHLRRQTENEDGATAPRTDKGARRKAAGGPDPSSRRLAEDVRRRLGWLGGVSWRRLAPTLAKFARAGWTVADVDLAVREVLTARGWALPRDMRTPAAYLAGLLRELDPADRPTRLEEEMRAAAAAERAHDRLLATGAPCAHGRPAGDVPSPRRGILACPECRQAAAASSPRIIGW